MSCCAGDGDRINSFALVSYIPDPLGSFLDQLRKDLVPGCVARSHVTLLPPRELAIDAEAASRVLNKELQQFQSFRLELGEIEIFEATQVVYLGIQRGAEELRRMHHVLNRDGLAFNEPYVYHPHVTLAQGCELAIVPGLFDAAREQWRRFPYPRAFDLDALTFVQNTARNRWCDLEQIPLAQPVGAARR